MVVKGQYFGTPSVYAGHPPLISIVVPVCNGAGTLAQCLSAILASKHKDFELIVVDDGSTDASATIAAQFTPQVIRHGTNRGRSAARATGHQIARGHIIICIDADIEICQHTLSSIVAHFEKSPDCSALSGILSDLQPQLTFASQYLNLRLNCLYSKLPHRIPFFYGGLFAFKRSVRHLFTSNLEICEDTDIGIRLSIKDAEILLAKDVSVKHLKVLKLPQLIRADLLMAFNWSRLFLENKLWRYLLRRHSILAQLLRYLFPLELLVYFLRKKGVLFALRALPVAIIQSLVIATGGIVGLLCLPLARRSAVPALEVSSQVPLGTAQITRESA